MDGIPPALDSDAEDVAWALQTADALWKRAERGDAIVWLRRAAQAAGEAQQDDRALELARGAAELSDLLGQFPRAPEATAPAPSAAPAAAIEELLAQSIEVDVDVRMGTGTVPIAFKPPGLPPPLDPTPPPAVAQQTETQPMVQPIMQPAETPASEPPSVVSSVSASSGAVRSAAEAHAGMLDPWANNEPPPLPRSSASVPQLPDDFDDEVVTSVKELQGRSRRVTTSTPPPLPVRAPPLPTEVHDVSITPSAPIVQAFAQEPGVNEPPSDRPFPQARLTLPSAEATLVSAVSDTPQAETGTGTEAETETGAGAGTETGTGAAAGTGTATATNAATETATETNTFAVEPRTDPTPIADALAAADLEAIEAFGDLPDDARANLAKAATVHSLAKDEEVTGFSLAIVLDGELDVAAMIVDIPADHLTKGRVLKPTGSLHESVPLRLICSSSTARVATWDAKDIEATFKTCPWIEDDLRAHADRVLALVGVTMGPLADRLDESIRAQITSRLVVRELPEGDVLVQFDAPVRELVIVGQGVIELIDESGVAVGSVGTGEVLFGSEVVSGGKATATARAGKGGALVLAVDRSIAQELIVTLPPLLELLVGM